MRKLTKTTIAAGAVALGLMLSAGSCDMQTEEQQRQNEKRDSVYEFLLKQHEVSDPTYSNDLENIDLWVDTWGTGPGTLAYVYLLDSNGGYISYLVLDGLPTTKCKNATPNYELKGSSTEGWVVVPAPGLSGTYSTGTGDCSTMYGRDASTGAYIEWTVGAALSMIVSNIPIPIPEGVEPPNPMGFTTIEEAEDLDLATD